MKKDITITAEITLIAHWNTPVDSQEEWKRNDQRLCKMLGPY